MFDCPEYILIIKFNSGMNNPINRLCLIIPNILKIWLFGHITQYFYYF